MVSELLGIEQVAERNVSGQHVELLTHMHRVADSYSCCAFCTARTRNQSLLEQLTSCTTPGRISSGIAENYHSILLTFH